MTMRADSSDITHYRELTRMVDFVETDWGFVDDCDGPTFLWDPTISSCSQHEDASRHDMPVARAEEAEQTMSRPMQWYFDGVAAIVPTARETGEGVDIPRRDMPSFRLDSQALAGVDAVVANALASDRWLDATRNLCLAVRMTARFIGSCEDRNQECLEYLKELIQLVRIYMDSVARNADTDTSAQALRMVTEVACNEDFRINPAPMIELLASCLSFARWDDTRVLAYDALESATEDMDDMARRYGDAAITDAQFHEMMANEYTQEFEDLDLLDERADPAPERARGRDVRELELHAHFQFSQTMLLMRHDLLRLGGDAQGADALLREHSDVAPLADAYAARLIHTRRWRDLLDFVERIERRVPEQFTMMFPEDLVPYDWDSLREIALQGLDDRARLQEMYRSRLLSAFDAADMPALTNLRRVCDDEEWDRQVELVVQGYHEEETHPTRNPVYEHLLVMRRMHDEAMRYLDEFPDAWPDLAVIL